ncbi:unnamed protein product [Gadus morhua 'NCC']
MLHADCRVKTEMDDYGEGACGVASGSLADRRPPSRREQTVCWGCGQPGHVVRECPKTVRAQGNGSGSA